MSRRLVILTEIISPYRIPLFNALAEFRGVDLHVIFLAETDPNLRQWRIYKEEIQFRYQVLPSWRKRIAGYNVLLNAGLGRGADSRGSARDSVRRVQLSCLVAGSALGADSQPSFPVVVRKQPARFASRPRGGGVLERASSCGAAQVLLCLGVRLESICARGRSRMSASSPHPMPSITVCSRPLQQERRSDAAQLRRELELPDRYFLFVGRLVPEKGVFDLLSAYAKLDGPLRRQVGLVFAGDGPSRRAIEDQAASISPGLIKFAGFAQRDILATYYALAEMLILPTYTDTWGLVVNEAMACSLPVILSRAAGCASDLLSDHGNGLLVPPRDPAALASAMTKLAQQPVLSKTMGVRSLERIAQYSPEAWAEGITQAVENIKGQE